MRMLWRVRPIILLFFSLSLFTRVILVQAQENVVPGQEGSVQEKKEKKNVEKSREQEAPEEELGFHEKTLIQDIQTAAYPELLVWCKSLGLSDKGSVSSLRQQLLKYYSLPVGKKKEDKDSVSIISIRSAASTEYFTIEQNDEQMVQIKGGVVIEMEENKKEKRTHRIEAEQMVFNQSKNLITASGSVKYTFHTKDEDHTFRGERLEFSVKSWNGLIYKGTSLRKKKNKSKEFTYYFQGDVLKKSGSGDIFILEKGILKTQDSSDPDFHLKASRLWLLGPREWGVLNGVLFIGHVPILYIPFYFKPGNELIFNPVFGTNQRKGNFIQTTTYLMGQKEEDEDISFLSLEDEGERYEMIREGLYLMKKGKLKSGKKNSDYWKVMIDWYSRLGAYAGTKGAFKWKNGSQFDFTSGMGVSRDIDSNNHVFFKDPLGLVYETQWNSSQIGDSELPFRWGNALNFKYKKLHGTLSFYSDPFFNQDFMNREESFDWLNTLISLSRDDEGENDSKKNAKIVDNMKWELVYSKTFNPSFAKPFVNSIGFNNIRMDLNWKKKKNNEVTNSYSPSRKFFYPDKITLPYIQMSLAGKPLSWSNTKGWGWKKKKKEDKNKGLLSPPWEQESEQKTKKKKEETQAPEVQAPEYWDKLFRSRKQNIYDTTFSYNYSFLLNMVGNMKSKEWNNPKDVDYSMKEYYLINNNKLGTTFSNYFLDKRISLVNKNTFSTNYRRHLEGFGLTADDITYNMELSDYRGISTDWQNRFNGKVYPFKYTDVLSGSNIYYNLNSQLYKKTFKSYALGSDAVYDEIWASWDKESIKVHKTGVFAEYKPEFYYISSNISTQLPPMDKKEIYTNKAGFNRYNLKGDLSHSFERDDEDWTFKPLLFTLTYTPFKQIIFTQNLQYDFEEEQLSKSYSRISVFGLYCAYTHEYRDRYTWDKSRFRWKKEEKDFVPSRLSTGYKLDLKKRAFWKHRINYTTNLNLDWTINLQQFNRNILTFRWKSHYHIFQFLDLNFSMSSSNKSMYLYFKPWREKLGIQNEYNFWKDLGNSFNIFSENQQDRRSSFFNLDKISFDLVHHLRDWDLTLKYTGYPKLENQKYEWFSQFSLFLIWNPITKLKTRVKYKDDKWSVDNE